MHIESVFSSSIEVRNSSPQIITHHHASTQIDAYLVYDGDVLELLETAGSTGTKASEILMEKCEVEWKDQSHGS